MSETLFVYGTLRRRQRKTYKVKGTLIDLGSFPGLVEGEGSVVVEALYVKDFRDYDRYESYNPSHPSSSMYLRKKVTTDCGKEGHIYVLNRPFSGNMTVVPDGNWERYSGRNFRSVRFEATEDDS